MNYPVLHWIPILISCLQSATNSLKDYHFTEIRNLSTKIVIRTREPLVEKDKSPIKTICSNFCEANESSLKSFSFESDKIELLVYVKRKNGPSLKNDPVKRSCDVQRATKKGSDVSGKGFKSKNLEFSKYPALQIHNRNPPHLPHILDTSNNVSQEEERITDD